MLIALIAAWCLGSMPVSMLVGRMIRAGRLPAQRRSSGVGSWP